MLVPKSKFTVLSVAPVTVTFELPLRLTISVPEPEPPAVKTKSGFHIITQPFNLLKFKEKYPDTDVQKKNPTLLYLPHSLSDENV